MNTRRLIGAAPWVLAAALMAGCGGGGEDQPQGTDPFPLSVGDQWALQVTDSNMAQFTETRRVTGTAVVDGVDVQVVQVQWSGGGGYDEYYQRTDTEVRRLPPSNATEQQLAIGPVVTLKLPLTDGQRWTQYDTMVAGTYDWDGDGIVDPVHEYAETSVQGPLTVSTPLGTFNNAYSVTTGAMETVIGTLNGDTVWTSTVTQEVYVPGIGVVQRYRNVTPQDGPRSYIRNDVLIGYDVAVP